MLHNKLSLTILVLIVLSVIPTESKTTADLVQCIRRIHLIKTPQSLESICDPVKETDPIDRACIKSVAGINQCLLLNECYNTWKEEMDVHCWNCWADYTTDSHIVEEFQDEVRKCNFGQKIVSVFGLIALIFVALMY